MIYLNSSAWVVTCQRRIAEEKNGEQQHATEKVHSDNMPEETTTCTSSLPFHVFGLLLCMVFAWYKSAMEINLTSSSIGLALQEEDCEKIARRLTLQQ